MNPMLKEKNDRFQSALCSSVGHFRKGEDNLGFNDFMKSLDDLESIMELNLQNSELEIDKLLAAIQMLYLYMQNQDITGLIDLLEFMVYPLSKEWGGGRDGL